jgi:hypothetical protein
LVVIKLPLAQLGARSWFDHGPMADVATSLGQAPSDPNKLAGWLNFNHGALGLGEGDARSALANATAVVSQTKSWLTTGNLNFEKIAFAMLEKSIKVRRR